MERFLPPAPLDQLIGRAHEVEHAGGRSLAIPLPHPSGASSWVNAPAHRALLERALALLGAELRAQWGAGSRRTERVMRGLVLVFALHGGDRWAGTDKIKHFFMSAFVESVSYSALRAAHVRHDPALVSASAVTLGVGIGKEIYDHESYGHFSVKDLTWDIAGTAAAATVLAHTR